MNINEFIGEKGKARFEDVKKRIKEAAWHFRAKKLSMFDQQALVDFLWMFDYVEFLQGNRRANEDGLD